jgi:WD40 repeat protein
LFRIGHTGSVFCVQLDGRYICSGSEGFKIAEVQIKQLGKFIMIIRIHDINGNLLRMLNGHQDSVICLRFDETRLVSGSGDKTIRYLSFIMKEFGTL